MSERAVVWEHVGFTANTDVGFQVVEFWVRRANSHEVKVFTSKSAATQEALHCDNSDELIRYLQPYRAIAFPQDGLSLPKEEFQFYYYVNSENEDSFFAVQNYDMVDGMMFSGPHDAELHYRIGSGFTPG